MTTLSVAESNPSLTVNVTVLDPTGSVTVFTGSLPGLNGGPSGTGYTDNQRPNRVTSEPCNAKSGAEEQIINPNAYTLNGFRLGTIGTAERGDCTGPGYFNIDLALYKNFPLGNGINFQFSWDI